MNSPQEIGGDGGLRRRKILAWRYWLTGQPRALAAYCQAAPLLLNLTEVSAIAARLRGWPCRFLVFGTGNDSLLWAGINRWGRTVFLENDAGWREAIAAQSRRLKIEAVTYTTRLAESREILHRPERLEMSLPRAVRDRRWDLILVDGPQGWGNAPGRMQSIYEASRLAAPRATIFVHDIDRAAEALHAGVHLAGFNSTPITERLTRFER